MQLFICFNAVKVVHVHSEAVSENDVRYLKSLFPIQDNLFYSFTVYPTAFR